MNEFRNGKYFKEYLAVGGLYNGSIALINLSDSNSKNSEIVRKSAKL